MNALDLLETAAAELEALAPGVEFVFFGATVIALHVEDPDTRRALRETIDVDAMVDVGLAEFCRIEAALRASGFVQPLADARRYRWQSPRLTLDLVRVEEFGATDAVARTMIENRVTAMALPSGRRILTLGLADLLAAKIAAFEDPHRENSGAVLASRDLEDIIVLLEGCGEVSSALAGCPTDVREDLRRWAAEFTGRGRCDLVVEAHVTRGTSAERELRVKRVMNRLFMLALAP